MGLGANLERCVPNGSYSTKFVIAQNLMKVKQPKKVSTIAIMGISPSLSILPT